MDFLAPERANLTFFLNPSQEEEEEEEDSISLPPLKLAKSAAMMTMFVFMALVWSSAGLMVVAVYRSPNMRRQFECWYLFNIAVAIVISGMVYPMSLGASVLRYTIQYKSDYHSPDECFVVNALFSIYQSITCTSVLFMALERYITILKPLTYCYILTERRIRGSIALTWCITFAFLAAQLGLKMAFPEPTREDQCDINKDFKVWWVNVVQSSCNAWMNVMVVGIYVHLHVIAQRHLHVIEQECRLFGLAQYRKNLKRTSVAFRITVFLLVMELPIYTINYLRIFSEDHEKLTRYADYMFFLSLLRQILQPAFYAIFSSDFRNSLFKILGYNRVSPQEPRGCPLGELNQVREIHSANATATLYSSATHNPNSDFTSHGVLPQP